MHPTQAIAPDSFWYVPASHAEHVGCSLASLYVPGVHGAGPADPTGHEVPGGHDIQSPGPVITIDAFMCVPAGHGSGADAPCAQ